MWATHVSRVLRPYIAPLYKLLNSPPGSNISIMPRTWPAFLHCLDSRAVVCREVHRLHLPIKSCIIEVGSKPVHCKADLPSLPKSTGPTWVRLSDPTCPRIKVTNAAQNSLYWLLPRIQLSPLLLCPCRLSFPALPEPMPWPKGTKLASVAGSPPSTASPGSPKSTAGGAPILAFSLQRCPEIHSLLRNTSPAGLGHVSQREACHFAPLHMHTF